MADIKNWNAVDELNVDIDGYALSNPYQHVTRKLMGAIKRKFDDVDLEIAGVAGAYAYKGTVDTVDDLPMTGNDVGDVYNVTTGDAQGNYAWDGAQWDKTGDSLVDVDGAQVLAKGSTTKRTLGDRFADVVNVKDFGAKGDGVTDDSDAVADAFAAADGSAVFFPSSHGENYGVELYNVYRNPENLYNRSSGLMVLSGTSYAPTSDPHAIIVAEKNSSAATPSGANYSVWDNGAIYAQLNQISGNAYGAAVTGFARSVGANGGQLVGVHGRGSAGASDSQVWGGWFYATAGAAGCKHLIGVEININNKNSNGDRGWGVSEGAARGLVVTAADGNPVPGLVGISIGAQTGSVGWHTGLTVYGGAVVTNTARAGNSAAVGDNEAIHLPGTANASSYGGIRFGDARAIDHHFWYGISFKEATFSNNCAILLGEGQKIKVGSDGSSICGMAFSRTNVCVNFENMVLRINNKQVVGERKTGWMVSNTGTPSKASFNAATVTTEELACRVIALINDLKAHGLIGVTES